MKSSVLTERAPAGQLLLLGVCMWTFGRKPTYVCACIYGKSGVASRRNARASTRAANSHTYTHCALLAGIKYAKACLQRDKRGEQIALCLPTSACALESSSSRHFLHCGARFFSFSLSKTPNSWTPLFTQRNALHSRAHTAFSMNSRLLSLSLRLDTLCMFVCNRELLAIVNYNRLPKVPLEWQSHSKQCDGTAGTASSFDPLRSF